MPIAPPLTTLTALAQALSRSADLNRSLDAALATVAEALGVETGWVWLLDEDSKEPRLAAARALPRALVEHPDAMRGDCYCLSTFRAGDLRGAANVNVVWCSRLAKVVDTSEDGSGTGGLRCHASVPLTVGERHLGMLNVASRDWRVLSEDELSLLTTAGALVSLAVERSRLEAVEERNRLAREIHDTLAQSLAGLTLQLEVADTLAGRAQGNERVRDAVNRALALARATLDEARRSVVDLRSSPIRGQNLPTALEQLAVEAQTGATNGLQVMVRLNGFEEAHDLPQAVAVGLYRIAQQALANVVLHSGATHALVHLSRDADAIRLRVEDDGIGFDPAEVPFERFGVIGMRERARLIGGTFSIETAPRGGVAIEAIVPLGTGRA
jgi:two-component system NarL family sensor kinase